MATSRRWSRGPRRERCRSSPRVPDDAPGAIIPGSVRQPESEVPELDIIFLLERLESLIATGTGVPATRKVLVDRDAILDLVDQLRVAIPEEVQAAKRINAESERILEKAGAEAQRIVSRAQEQAAFLISERGLTERALDESRRIVEEAQRAAEETRRGADDYALQMLEGLEEEMDQALTGVRKGLGVLDSRRAELRAAEAAAAAEAEAGGAGDGEAAEDEDDDEDDGSNGPSPAFLREGDAGSRSGAG